MRESRAFSELADVLQRLDRTAIMLSGGMDSEVLLRAAVNVLGRDSILAITARTPFLAVRHITRIDRVTQSLCVEHHYCDVDLLCNENITANTEQRCYICKYLICSAIVDKADRLGFSTVSDGTNSSDLAEDRPGMKAVEELGIAHPLLLAGLGKNEIRQLTDILCPGEDIPQSDSCLATRIASGQVITENKLKLIEKMEHSPAAKVSGKFRVRLVDNRIAVEYDPIDRCVLDAHIEGLSQIAKTYGYTIDFREKPRRTVSGNW